MIKLSILSASIVKFSGFISQKTGISPFLDIACVVEAKVNGVVITSLPLGKLKAAIMEN